jgi:hypothetical protein
MKGRKREERKEGQKKRKERREVRREKKRKEKGRRRPKKKPPKLAPYSHQPTRLLLPSPLPPVSSCHHHSHPYPPAIVKTLP